MSTKEKYSLINENMRISELCFTIPDSIAIRKSSELAVVNQMLYEDLSKRARQPSQAGVLDPRLGISQKNAICATCEESLTDCVGHFGHIDLTLPIFHTGFMRFIVWILSCVCKRCSRVLLPKPMRQKYIRRVSKPRMTYLEKKAIHKDIVEKCKKMKDCKYCGAFNGPVRKIGAFKVAYSYRPATAPKKKKDSTLVLEDELAHLTTNNKDLEEYLLNQKQELLNPLKVQKIFHGILDEDLPLLFTKGFRPSDLIISRIPVPPACIRPTVTNELDTGSNEDDLTIKLSEILLLDNSVRLYKTQRPSPITMLMDLWDHIQIQYALYINGESSGIPLDVKPKKPFRGLVQRLKGKHGRFRGNLSGKRVDFSSRSVISPNPTLQIDEVGVPEHIAKILTYPELVTPYNIEKMRQLIRNGADRHPGANFRIERSTGQRVYLKFGNREAVAARLQAGDIIERHMADGDMVLFNRQPSLHKLSIMCHRARIHIHRTLQFNECVCTPYNADFDGDEMNLHLLQTEEAKAEAAILMGTKQNIITPRNGEPLISSIQDFITGGYLMTQKNVFLDHGKACQLISQILSSTDSHLKIDLPPPAIMKPCRLWTGKQIISMVLKPNKSSNLNINLRCRGRNYSGKGEDFDPNDSFVVFRNSELLAGSLDKTTLGSGSKNNIFYVALRDANGDQAGAVMWRLAKVTSFWIMNEGFSLGIEDVTPTRGLLRRKAELLETGYERVTEYIQSLKDGKLEPLPGQNQEKTLETFILKELSNIREAAGKACTKELGWTCNAPLIMSLCGSKGSLINVSQMVACVGQQAIRGERVPDGYLTRSLPHFDPYDKSPLAKGFVENSFYSGLTTTEFFFHTMAGREGLLDTAVKTAETGYMQRRLMKALEDLVIHYDGSIRNSVGEVIQFQYGDDCLDPAFMESNDQPVHLDRLLLSVKAGTAQKSLMPGEVEAPKSTPLPESPTRTRRGRVSKSSPKKSASQPPPPPSPEKVQLEDPQVLIDQLEGSIASWDLQISPHFKDSIRDFLTQQIQSGRQLTEATNKSLNTDLRDKAPVLKNFLLTKEQLASFMDTAKDKYLRARLEPGSSVGAICAQSIGEPATQMTLKTFHFAGVASMNITQGVPRIKELINANKTISTPVIRAELSNPYDLDHARITKMRIEKTTLGQVCSYIEEFATPDDCFVLVKLNLKRIEMLRLEMDAFSISDTICSSLRIAPAMIKIINPSTITILTDEPTDLWKLRDALERCIIRGFPSVKRAAIRVETDKDGRQAHYLMIEGEGLREIMGTYGVNPNKCTSNNVMEILSCLGVEAARSTIIGEVQATMNSHGIGIDLRHLKLLADLMTYRGEVLGITRFGLAKMKESSLMLASFEKTADHLFDAAYYGQEDPIAGASECIISGMPMRIGTGFFDVIHRLPPGVTQQQEQPEEPTGRKQARFKPKAKTAAQKKAEAEDNWFDQADLQRQCKFV